MENFVIPNGFSREEPAVFCGGNAACQLGLLHRAHVISAIAGVSVNP